MIEASAQWLVASGQQLTANENKYFNSENLANSENSGLDNIAVQLNTERLKFIDEISRLIFELKEQFPKLAQYLSKARDNFSANQENIPIKNLTNLLTQIQQNLNKPDAVETVKSLVGDVVKILQPSTETPPEYKLILALSKNDFASADIAAKNIVQTAVSQTQVPQQTQIPQQTQTLQTATTTQAFQTILNALQELKEFGIPIELKNAPLKELETVVLQKTGIEIDRNFQDLRNLQNFFYEKPIYATVSLLPANQTVHFEKTMNVVEIPLPKDFPVQKIFSNIHIPPPPPPYGQPPVVAPQPQPNTQPPNTPYGQPPVVAPQPPPPPPLPQQAQPQQNTPYGQPPVVALQPSVVAPQPPPLPPPPLPQQAQPQQNTPYGQPPVVAPQPQPNIQPPNTPYGQPPVVAPQPPVVAPQPPVVALQPQPNTPPPIIPQKIEMAFSLHQITIPQNITPQNTQLPAPKFILQPWPVSTLIPKEERNFWLKTDLPLTPQILNIRDAILSFGKLPENTDVVKLFANNVHELSLQVEQGTNISKEQVNLLWRIAQNSQLSTLNSQLLKYQPTGNYEGELFKNLPEPVKRELQQELPAGKTWQPETLQKAVEKILEKYVDVEPQQLSKTSQNEHIGKHSEEIRQVLQNLKEQIQWTRIDQDTRLQNDRENVFYFMHEGNLQKGRLKIKDERKGSSKKQQSSSISFSIETKTKNLGDVHADLTLNKNVLNIRLQDSVGTASEAVQTEREYLAKELADIGIVLGELLYGKIPKVRNLPISKTEEKKNSGLDVRA
jgi:hypothetical protein